MLALLWRESLPRKSGGRGPKQTVSVDAVVAAAVALADRAGYAKVSIRSVAAELDLRPMSLYTYIPSKEVLEALMTDAVAAEDAPIPPELPVRERMAAIARQVRAELLAHPWLLEVSPWRVILGPWRMRRYERHLAALEGVGLTDLEMDRAVAVLGEFATGNARMAIAAERAAATVSDADWWAEYGPALTALMPVEQFPVSNRVGAAVGEYYGAPADPAGDFDFGLSRLIDGILSGRSVGNADGGRPL
ncbi:TetR family transcriptional regulator [Nocardia panacis]|uniref:TetR family transcriptional regulator n=1 Tax=Nocardia panacis TaxID=2340916 RepID=A0A3A4K0R4_9NOCA|nr:TetR family transcriptional regulator [Nocardia panacis]